MKHWQQLNLKDRLDVLGITSAKTLLPRLAVEKDWWVTMVLKALSTTRYFKLMSFKGGTSLSKGWNLINRFSEDIDIAMRRESVFSISSTSGNQLAKVRRTARHYIVRELPDELTDALNKMGIADFTIVPELTKTDIDGNISELRATTHPSTIFVHYKSVLPEEVGYIQPKVKIEISCLSMDEPVEVKSIRSFMAEVLNDEEDVEVQFPTVLPTRTFLEKIFLLHEEFQKENPRSIRMSRHLYDIEKIMDTEFSKSIEDGELYERVVTHRSIFNKMEGIDYSLHSPSTVSFIPPASIMKEWEKDYQSMQQNFIYDRISLSFNELITRMQELTARIRNLQRQKPDN
ncbi:MAG: nucleotidyl transferase AbiEii/AbiGii toxin family protein [Bacteroides sp.]|nr:nucleotidyl transferase AbiEii/AbiGii toxin family protein [Bacteroides sp.]